jgi:putative endonuclease
MAWPEIKRLLARFRKTGPEHLQAGRTGEAAAKKHLQKAGLKFLTANFAEHGLGEIDLIFRDGDCLAFVEVKARSSEEWTRPAAAVDRDKRRRLVKMSLRYRRLLPSPYIKYRFDIVEVLLENGKVQSIRHLPNAFTEDLKKR